MIYRITTALSAPAEGRARGHSMPICCLCAERGQDIPSPFGRIIGIHWYDGLLAGFAECRECGTAYWFSVVGWYHAAPGRVYALAPMGGGDSDRIAQALGVLGPPKWPVWVPIWEFEDPVQQSRVEAQIDTAIAGVSPPCCLIYADEWNLGIADSRVLQDDAEISVVMDALRNPDVPSSADARAAWLAFLGKS